MEIIYQKNQTDLAKTGAAVIAETISDLLKKQPQVILALAGGRSLAGIFVGLAKDKIIDWSRVHIFMVDERLVPLNDLASNFSQANQALIEPLIKSSRLAEANVHPFIFMPNQPDFGLEQYTAELKRHGGKYDIILLGAGEDGHIAALFPQHHSIFNEAEFYLTFSDSPKSPPGRLTASKTLLAQAQAALIVFLGEAKLQAYHKFLDPKINLADCPAKLVKKIKHSYLLTDLDGYDKNSPSHQKI